PVRLLRELVERAACARAAFVFPVERDAIASPRVPGAARGSHVESLRNLPSECVADLSIAIPHRLSSGAQGSTSARNGGRCASDDPSGLLQLLEALVDEAEKLGRERPGGLGGVEGFNRF